MICSLLASTILLSSPGQTAGQRISEMIGRFHGTKTVVASIAFTQTAGNTQVKIGTELQVDRTKRRLYLIQQGRADGQDQRRRMIASGDTFLYPAPKFKNKEQEELTEPQSQGPQQYTERDVYAFAASQMLDDSFPLQVIIGHQVQLQKAKAQLATLQINREDTLGDKKVIVISGKFRDYKEAAPSAIYELWLTEDNELVRFVKQEVFQPGTEKGVPLADPVRIVSVWDVKATLDGPVDDNLFKF